MDRPTTALPQGVPGGCATEPALTQDASPRAAARGVDVGQITCDGSAVGRGQGQGQDEGLGARARGPGPAA
jgi:hypothetical protein